MKRITYILAIAMFLVGSYVFAEPIKLAMQTPEVASPFKHTGDGTIELFNTHNQERISIQFREEGRYTKDAIAAINHILRCRFMNIETRMSLQLIELVDKIQDHFGGREVHIISGYRAPEFNTQLRASGHKVAKYSLHMEGLAMDIRIPGVSTKAIRDYAASLKAGGVGYYPGNDFVHVDVGRVRYW